jgi:anti-sigma factor RsiW
VRRHLQDCQSCAGLHQQRQALRSAIRNSGLAYLAPPSLHTRIHSAVDAAERHRPSRIFARQNIPVWLGLAASLLIAFLLVWKSIPNRSDSNDLLTQALLSSHVRSLMASHLTDVPSSDSHTVKPWFNGKLDFSPLVKDLAAQNFPLVGGRLEYLDRPVAALVYRRHQHIINVFVWPSATASARPTETPVSRNGFNLLHWTSSGMSYWAVSDLNLAELRQFVQLLQQ